MTKRTVLYFTLCIFLLMNAALNAQEKPAVEPTYQPLILKLNEDGSKYIRFITWHQIWVASNNLSADQSKLQFTPSLRRSRFLTYAQVSPKFLILTHFGINNLTPSNLTALGNDGDAPQLFLHGAWGEFRINEGLYIGGGLHYWNGLVRLASQSTLNFMTLDQSRPFASWHSLGVTDQFGRHLGFYAKGQLGQLDYRVAVNAPLRKNLGDGKDYGMKDSPLTYTGALHADTDGYSTGNTILQGYFRYNFWDAESSKLPYNVGTYLGNKKVFAVGTGFFLHPNGMYRESTGEHSAVKHWAVDLFVDLPTRDGAFNGYASFIQFDYGPDYVSRWAGTGAVFYGQLGYFWKPIKVMPYTALQYASYEGFEDPVRTLDVGINYFIQGHNAKLTLEYHHILGDIREAAIATQEGALSQLRLQMHVFL